MVGRPPSEVWITDTDHCCLVTLEQVRSSVSVEYHCLLVTVVEIWCMEKIL